MFEKETWYKEVLIIVLFAILINVITSLFIPFPYTYLITLPLIVLFAIWRIRIKAVTVKEIVAIYLIEWALTILVEFFVPFPYSWIVTIALLFLVIWVIHKRASK